MRMRKAQTRREANKAAVALVIRATVSSTRRILECLKDLASTSCLTLDVTQFYCPSSPTKSLQRVMGLRSIARFLD